MSIKSRIEKLEKIAKTVFNKPIVKLVFSRADIVETDKNVIYVLMEI